jgi:hypothetical protein
LRADVAAGSEEGLVRAYHEVLLAEGVPDYPFEQCWRDYQLSKLFLLYRYMMGINLIDLSHERGQILLDRILERMRALWPTDNLDVLLQDSDRRLQIRRAG